MNADEMEILLNEVFSDFKITRESKEKYDKTISTFYIKSESYRSLNYHGEVFPRLEIQKLYSIDLAITNFIIGTQVMGDVWQISLSLLGDEKFVMNIPGTSYERNKGDIGDPKSFLELIKTKIREIREIKEMSNKVTTELIEIKKEPIKKIRDFKLNKIL